MTSRDFCFWLQGYFEIQSLTGGLTTTQTETVQRHLALVTICTKLLPSMPDPTGALQAAHDGQPTPLNYPPGMRR